jgi:hypothetical protein
MTKSPCNFPEMAQKKRKEKKRKRRELQEK